jgi:hypothetical protein
MGAYTYSTTASSNTSIDGLGNNGAVDPPSNIDNLVGRLAAAQAAFVRDLGAVGTVGGTANAITLAPIDPSSVTAYFNGMIVSFRATANNSTTTPTLNVDSVGTKVIKKAAAGVETALVVGDIKSGGHYTVVYRTAWDAAAGAWELLNPGTLDGLPWSGANLPVTNNAYALGSASLGWSDAFFGSGAVLNWDNGTYTLTQNNDSLVGSGNFVSGGTDKFTYATGVVPGLQSNKTDANGVGASRFSADALGPVFAGFKSRNASIGSHTAVQSGDALARFIGYGSNGSSGLPAAEIRVEVEGTPSGDMPGRIVFGTTNVGGSSPTDRWIMTRTGAFAPNADNSYDIGTTALSVRTAYFASNGTIDFGNGASQLKGGVATVAEQEAGSSDTKFVSPGTQHRHPSACKVWGMTTGGGTPSLDGSYNMTSITDAGTGILTVTFATDFSGATWGGSAIAASNTNNNRMCCLVTRAAGSVNLESSSATTTLADPAGGYAWAFFGDQA